ncbi:hypothetical protein [Streptomyces sp. LS1784]|uniref:hypothetical protein n=1 Tax=Streptomyces sp. LS1784 TaxID=2851533 RepID=UPI001CCD8739|nr:hypothetical protein [Streptomyces sp. LS1784]
MRAPFVVGPASDPAGNLATAPASQSTGPATAAAVFAAVFRTRDTTPATAWDNALRPATAGAASAQAA